MGFLWVTGFSFFHCVASPFHSFVTTAAVGPRGYERRVGAGVFGWLYAVLRSRCDNHGRHVGSPVGTELDMQRGVADVGDGNARWARAASQCMHAEARERPLACSGRAGW